MNKKPIPQDITDFVNSIDFNNNISQKEKDDVMKVLYIYRGIEGSLGDDLINKQYFQKCISYDINKYLCESTNNSNIIKSQYSHIVPRNQLEKMMKEHNNEVFLLSSSFHELIQKKQYIKANTQSGGFAGFCSDCEQLFSKNIDTLLTPKTEELILSTFRFLGKEIRILELFLPIWEKIVNGTEENARKTINKEGFEILIPSDSMEQFIKDKKIIYLRLISFFIELKTYWINKDSKKNSNNPSYFSFKSVTLSHDILPVIGQSFGVLPSYFNDVNANFPIFTLIEFNSNDKKTNFHIFLQTPLFNNLKTLKMNNKEWAYLILYYSLNYYNNIYFAECVKEYIDFFKVTSKSLSKSSNFLNEAQNIIQKIRTYINKNKL